MTDFQQGIVVGAIAIVCVIVGVMAAGPWLAVHLIKQLFDDMRTPEDKP